MVNEIEMEVSMGDAVDSKPIYQRPVLTDLDVGETALGVVPGAPENSSFIS